MSIIPWKTTNNIQLSRGGHSYLNDLQEEINHLFNDFFAPTKTVTGNYLSSRLASPAVDVIETEKNYKIKTELPGIETKNVDVSFNDNLVTIRAERKEEKEEKESNYLRRESSYGTYQRTIALPESADFEKAEASFKNGVLNIEVPKKAEAQKQPKKINVKEVA